jgi:bleomycin hydrolase
MSLKMKKPVRRSRNENDDQNDQNEKKIANPNLNENSVKPNKLISLKQQFYQNENNRVIQNALCSNSLWCISENREYMQSRDDHFSHSLDPKLIVSNQGLSGRCWLFALLNVMRHELVRAAQLPLDFELSEAYLTFYEKLEKCNFVLNKFMDKNEINSHDLKTQYLLTGGHDDGGTWITCANLIRKYGIIPKSCFKESCHSFDTDELNEILGSKLREFIFQLVNEKNKTKRKEMKEKMMSDIYTILAKMLGTPPSIDEKIEWSYLLRLDINEKLERELKRKKGGGNFETLEIKKTVHVTPHEFYKNFIVSDLDDYFLFSNDPRNQYHQYYQSNTEDVVIEGERNGFYNLPIDDMINLCVASIRGNTPIQFDCDVSKYLHTDENLFDKKCFNYDLLFNMKFETLNKEERMKVLDSGANHAMIIVGVDCKNEIDPDDSKKIKEIPIKFKIENSWGRKYDMPILSDGDDSGHYTMTTEWFKEYVYNIVIHKDFVSKALQKKYYLAKAKPITLPENDIMA